MWSKLGQTALVVAVLAGTAQCAQAQSKLSSAAGPDMSMTVFHGTPGEVESAAAIPGYGSSAPPGYTTSAGGTTVFHGTPAGAPSRMPTPPWVSPPPALGSGR